MDYKKISHLGIIIGLIGACFSLVISLSMDSPLLESLQKAFIIFIVLWFSSQLIWILVLLSIVKAHEELKEEKRQEIVDEQKRKIEENDQEAVSKLSNGYKKISSEYNEKMDKMKDKMAKKVKNNKGQKMDVTVQDQE